MNKNDEIKLTQALNEISNLRRLRFGNHEFPIWRNSVSRLLELAFGKGSSEYNRFINAPGKGFIVRTEQGQQEDYSFRLDCYENALKSILDGEKPAERRG